jgi:2',3'-cyclic-nucleotide 2'-phosphodiesterase/3'-nucleotidase
MTKRKIRINSKTGIVLTVLVLGLLIGLGSNRLQRVFAAKSEAEIVDLRIIGTTDLHGQLNSNDYELGVDYNNGGLARVFDLIRKTKKELPEGNTITLDNGDVLFDYTTEYIFSSNQEAIQPIYKAMYHVGYDAITLGNHDFDYGYDYILRQLDGSGLRDITIVSNVTDARTGEHPFLENMLITRNVKTRSGKVAEVKIGIIGQTIPQLTGKTHSYVGILTGEDMVENAKKQAAKLQEMGADIIIALSHTGIGPENPEPNFKNVAYALTKIPEIDVVIAGHEHNLYPTTDMTSAYYKLPGVDKNTYLINGKNVVMAGDRGKAIGVVDLALEVKNDKVRIVDRKSSLRMVTEKNTVEDKVVAGMFGEWEDELLLYASDVIAQLEPGTVLQNFYGLLADNAAIQLLNDSKIHYAINNVIGNDSKYINYPVIAASTYESFGVKSINDFVNITDKITESDLTTLQNYNSYLYVYTITGAQLKEWLEWSASAYETTVRETSWKDSTMSSLMKQTGLKSLIREEWLNDWSNFYVFDGISYEIDPSKNPRYDFSGNLVSNSRRVSNVYYQGKEVTDDMELLIATNKITKPTDANKGVENQTVLKGFVRGQSVLGKYIRQLSESGSIMPHVDYNWRIKLTSDYQFIIKVPYYSKNQFEATKWYKKQLLQKDQYIYYAAAYPYENGDTTAPHMVVTPLVTNPTASPYEVMVQAADSSEIKYLKYFVGERDINDPSWAAYNDIPSKGFTVNKNGIYTIYAEDIYGNKAIRKLVIDNFNENMLPRPTVDNYTNRKKKISGKAEPNTTLIIETPNGIYEKKLNGNGTFSVELPGQLADSYIFLYVKNQKGLESERVPVKIKRTGPNQPLINPAYNNEGFLTGNARDSISTVVAIIDDVAYVSKDGGRELFEANTEIYSTIYDIVETIVDVADNGQFIILLPPQDAGTSISIYAIDHVSRNSRVSTVKVQEAAPNAPKVNEVSNIERAITGHVPSGANTNIQIQLEGKIFTTKTDREGNFTYNLNTQLYAGQSIVVTAYDVKGGKERYSFPTEIIVNDIEVYDRPNSTNLILNRVTDKSNMISGYYYGGGTVYVAIATGEGRNFRSNIYSTTTDHDYSFMYRLNEKLAIGTKVYAMVRFENGRILLARALRVTAGRPDMPKLLNEITNTDKEVRVVSIKDVVISLKIGKKEYTGSKYEYDQTAGQYIYTLETDRALSGTKVTITARNDAGTSDPLVTELVKAAPDSPVVNTIFAGDKTITGAIELIDYVNPQEVGSGKEEKLPKEFKSAPSEVAKTQTRVYAQIGAKTYKGSIDNKGNFTIDIPEQIEGTAIKLWGTNKAGRGPLVKVIVAKKQ